jgi:hypothetical protein
VTFNKEARMEPVLLTWLETVDDKGWCRSLKSYVSVDAARRAATASGLRPEDENATRAGGWCVEEEWESDRDLVRRLHAAFKAERSRAGRRAMSLDIWTALAGVPERTPVEDAQASVELLVLLVDITEWGEPHPRVALPVLSAVVRHLRRYPPLPDPTPRKAGGFQVPDSVVVPARADPPDT